MLLMDGTLLSLQASFPWSPRVGLGTHASGFAQSLIFLKLNGLSYLCTFIFDSFAEFSLCPGVLHSDLSPAIYHSAIKQVIVDFCKWFPMKLSGPPRLSLPWLQGFHSWDAANCLSYTCNIIITPDYSVFSSCAYGFQPVRSPQNICFHLLTFPAHDSLGFPRQELCSLKWKVNVICNILLIMVCFHFRLTLN